MAKFQAQYESKEAISFKPLSFILEAKDKEEAQRKFEGMLLNIGIGIDKIDRTRIRVGEIVESGFFGIQRLPF